MEREMQGTPDDRLRFIGRSIDRSGVHGEMSAPADAPFVPVVTLSSEAETLSLLDSQCRLVVDADCHCH
jgi:hypothetical protein